jgi:hypothetical protein
VSPCTLGDGERKIKWARNAVMEPRTIEYELSLRALSGQGKEPGEKDRIRL